MKHFYKPILIFASFLAIGEKSEARFSNDKAALSFGSGSVAFKSSKQNSKTNVADNKLLLSSNVASLHLVDEKNGMVFYPNNLLSLRVLLKNVGLNNDRNAMSIASLAAGNSKTTLHLSSHESLVAQDIAGVEAENFSVSCLQRKQYFVSWIGSAANQNGFFKISYINANNQKITVHQTLPQNAANAKYTAMITLPEAVSKPLFKLEFEDVNHASMALASTIVNSDADGEMVDMVGNADESSLFVKSVGSNGGGTYKLDVYDALGNLIVGNQDVEIMAGSSQIIPVDLPQSEHGQYVAVLSNPSKKKKKVFKISI